MTALDDGLNTSAPVFAPPVLTVFWPEALSNVVNSGNPDAVVVMDDQMTGEYTVDHSLDDGLPDPVTMTSSNDASGSAGIPLIGRPGIKAEVIGWRTPRTETGTVTTTGSTYEIEEPSNAFFGDHIIAVLTIDKDSTTVLTQQPGINDEQWTLLAGPIVDGTTSMYVFSKPYWPGMSGLRVSFSSATVAFSFIACGVYARAANSAIWIDFDPLRTTGAAESASVSVHTAPAVTMNRRGYAVTFWGLASGSGAGPMAYGGPGVELAEITTGLRLMMATTGVVDPGTYTLQTTTSGGATATMVMASLALEVKDRANMDARQYFSPFNKSSPVYGWDRDTALVYLDNTVLTPVGVVNTTIFSGQMADITLKSRQVELEAISKSRIDLDTSLVLPVVSGDRENASIDWLVTWAMARGGHYAGPAPSKMTRLWAPMYGSTHAHFESLYCYGGAVFYTPDRSPSGPYGLRPPSSVQGPFMTAMYAQQTNTEIQELFHFGHRLDLARDKGLPGPYGSYLAEDWEFNDQFSKANSAGRVTFWIRGDAIDVAPSYVTAAEDIGMYYYIYCRDSAGVFLGYIMISLSTADRYMRLRMGADHTGSTTIVYNVAGQQIPTDGEWHFVGVKWDYEAGSGEVNVDGVTSVSSAYATNGDNDISLLPNTETEHIPAGGTFTNTFRSHLPVSDLCVEAGPDAFSNDWSWHYPIPQGLNALARPTFQPLQVIAQSEPIQGWQLLTDLARVSMSHYRLNESDSFEWLPLSYFGESAQLTPSVTADTDVNASELDVKLDPTKTRNVVTVKFPETRIDSRYTPILQISSSTEIIKGVSEMTFALDTVAAEIHGQSSPFGSNWDIINLSAAAISTYPAGLPGTHWMTGNTLPDGSGNILFNVSLTARIISATASTVTIQFTNKTGKSVYLANTSPDNSMPFLEIYGYAVNWADGYVTQRDDGSVRRRRDRSLDVEMDWIQSRAVATEVASHMVTALARPRSEVMVTVMGDPRRVPGQLVQLSDSQGTQAEGTWRILSVKHNGAGAQYTQDLQLVFVPPVGDWDGLDGWDDVIWAP